MHDAASAAHHLYTFGPYRLDSLEHRLLRDGQTVPLPPKAFDLLVVLVSRAGTWSPKSSCCRRSGRGRSSRRRTCPTRSRCCAKRSATSENRIGTSRLSRSAAIDSGGAPGNEPLSLSRQGPLERRPAYLQASRRPTSPLRQVTVRSSVDTFWA